MIVEALPRNPGGKVLKGRLRDEYAATASYSAGPTDTALLDETIGANFERTASTYPDAEALVDVAQRTAVDLRRTRRRNRLAWPSALMASGIEQGDRVGIWAPNCPEWTILQYATAKIGAILVTINPAYRTHELAYVLQHSGVRLLVSAIDVQDVRLPRHGRRGASRGPRPGRGACSWAPRTGNRCGSAPIGSPTASCARGWTSLTADDPINIQYTSGTTGSPKGATLSHRNILNNGFFVTDLINFGPGDRLCIPVPFYHCFGMVMGNLGCTTHGATMVIPAAGFDPGATLAAVEAERCTALYGVPTMFIAMLGHPDLADRDVSSLRTGIMAGSPCPVEVMKRCVNELNMSEVGDRLRHDRDVAGVLPDPASTTTWTVAPPPSGGHIRTSRSRSSTPTPAAPSKRGDAGRVLHPRLLGDARLLGRRRPETREAIDDDGWMHTGDLAVMRDDGYCTIVGRIKDMVIRGGENVYPREIEEFLHTHPDIDDVQVIGVPDEKYGEEICAWIKMRPGARAAGRRRRAGVRIRQARALQDPALRPPRRRVPDDGHRQGPQGRHAGRDGATCSGCSVHAVS